MPARAFRSLLCAVLCWSCSSEPAGEIQGAAGTNTSGPSTAERIRSSCLDFARRLCQSAESCCRSSYGGFDLDNCVAELDSDVCRPGGDTVQAGFAHYDESFVEGCLEAHAEAHAICVPDFAETVELRKRIFSACKVLRGTTPPGRSCTTRVTCEQPDGPASADCVLGRCTLLEILPEGAECPFPDGEVSVCDNGLFCDAPGRGTTGTCRAATPLGEPCDASLLGSQECGLGSYCDLDEASCKLATNRGGPTCAQGTECVSLVCDRSAGECAPPPAVVAESLCLGTATPEG